VKPLITKIKNFVANFLLLAVSSSIVLSCSPASVVENPAADEESPAVIQLAENRYGIRLTAKSLCSDGKNTILSLQTDLDSEFWQFSENDFYPKSKTYFETSVLFLENNEMYSTVSSGKRENPVFDLQNNIVSTMQTFVFPKTPLLDTEFTVKAKVFLGDLPSTYTPPLGVSFLEPGAIEIPMEYVTSASLSACP